MRRRGFTLVELLVVIAVIAVLISMLLPALTKARYQANKIACSSNLRQFAVTLQQYSELYGGTMLMGHYWNHDLGNMVGGGNSSPTNFLGLLDAAGLIKNLRVFYCPLQGAAIMQYGTTNLAGAGAGAWNNTWPPVDWRQCYIGYTVRPVGDQIPAMVATAGSAGPILNAFASTTYLYPPNGGTLPWDMSVNPALPGWVKATQLPLNTAIAADMVDPNSATVPVSIVTQVPQFSHMLDGNNVAYLDGSVQFVPYKIFRSNQLLWQNSYYSYGGNTAYLLSNMNNLKNPTPLTGIWADYDNYAK